MNDELDPHYTIAIDVMGGDLGPKAAIPAALMALKQYAHLTVILVGDKACIAKHLADCSDHPKSRCFIHHATPQASMNESLLQALPYKTDSSMRVALDLVKQNKADACVSAGNTRTLTAMARFVLNPLPGIDQPAISVALPTLQPNHSVRLLDLGANLNAQVEHLFQCALMGLVLSKEIDQVVTPKLALLNIGAEPKKGNHLLQKAGGLFSKQAEVLHYIGYIEGDSLFSGQADVVICDGFTGNTALKVVEGVVQLLYTTVNQSLRKSGLSRLAGGFIKPFLKQMEKQLNLNYYNGASLVGLQGTVIKSHGKANSQAFNYAIQRAIAEIQQNIPQRIANRVSER